MHGAHAIAAHPTNRAPVVSVGNLAMGGRGKTPVAALIAAMLVRAGEHPAILSRGYKRARPEEGVVIVSDGHRQLADVARGGDEPVLMARQVPGAAVLVCDVRAMAAALAEEQLGATVHVLDDGLQHHSLRRDIDIVLIAPGDLDDRRFPFGRLRSPLETLRGVDAVIVDGVLTSELDARLGKIVDRGRTEVYTLTRRLGELRAIRNRVSAKIADVLGNRVSLETRFLKSIVAVAGIAAPARFADALTAAGYTVADLVAFPDHHAYTRRDLARVKDAIERAGVATAVTTEKDEIRLLPLRPLGVPIAVAPLEVDVEPSEHFEAWLLGRVGEVRRCRD